MVAAIKDYKMILIMPENLSQERRDAMVAYLFGEFILRKLLGLSFATFFCIGFKGLFSTPML
jgi:hypothetical protein